MPKPVLACSISGRTAGGVNSLRLYIGPTLLLLSLVVLGLDSGNLWYSAIEYPDKFVEYNFFVIALVALLYLLGGILLIVNSPSPPTRFMALIGIALGIITAGVLLGIIGNGGFSNNGTPSLTGSLTGAIGGLATLATTIKSIADTFRPKSGGP